MQIVECPRDAMQGIANFIPTERKVAYLNQLLKVGFHSLDFGSFVSPKAIPQMRDTAEVLAGLDLSQTETQLLAIVANERGAEQACSFEAIDFLGFPMSISPTFQLRNTNKTIEQALQEVAQIQELCIKYQKILVVYLSMGFGNPYGEAYNYEIVQFFAQKIADLGVSIISLADTIGIATAESVRMLCQTLIKRLPHIQIGLHLHSSPQTAIAKIAAALEAGCQRLDGAMLGFGGCPMAEDELVGNIDTTQIVAVLANKQLLPPLNQEAWQQSRQMAAQLFAEFH